MRLVDVPYHVGETFEDDIQEDGNEFLRIFHILENAHYVLNASSIEELLSIQNESGMMPLETSLIDENKLSITSPSLNLDTFSLSSIMETMPTGQELTAQLNFTSMPIPMHKDRLDNTASIGDLERHRKPQSKKIDNDSPRLQQNHSHSRFRSYQEQKWNNRFDELVHFKELHGHCLVPNTYPSNQPLAQWTKRQRYQYNLKMLGRRTTLTDERQDKLEALNFVWHSHNACWYEKYELLKGFHAVYGHSNVPATHHDQSLAIWVKCQRRRMKLHRRGVKSYMTTERMLALRALKFNWNPRNLAI